MLLLFHLQLVPWTVDEFFSAQVAVGRKKIVAKKTFDRKFLIVAVRNMFRLEPCSAENLFGQRRFSTETFFGKMFFLTKKSVGRLFVDRNIFRRKRFRRFGRKNFQHLSAETFFRGNCSVRRSGRPKISHPSVHRSSSSPDGFFPPTFRVNFK